MISLDPIVNFVKKTSAGLPQAQFEKYIIYVVPFIYSAISNGVTLSTGFAVVSKQTTTQKPIKPQVKITVNCNTQSEDGMLNTNQEIIMSINAYPVATRLIVNNIQLEENSELDDEENIDKDKIHTVPPVYAASEYGIWNTKQYSIDEFYGCALFVGTANITNLDIETIFTNDTKSDNKCYILGEDETNQFKEQSLANNGNFEVKCISGTDSTATIFDILNGCLKIKNTTLKELLTQTQMSLFKKSGYISPYINIGSLNYLLVESNDFDLNDFGWDAMYQTYYKNVDQSVYPQNSPDLINDIFKYNMAMLNNKDNEEFNPTLRNPDYISIHTFRKEHGIVDFYFPLNFLFIC